MALSIDSDFWEDLLDFIETTMGTENFDSKNVFLGASKTFPIDEKGFVKTVTFQGGFRESWIEAPDRNTNRFYGGVEVQLPHDIYLIGEVTQFSHRKDQFTPWAAGIQWRGRRIGSPPPSSRAATTIHPASISVSAAASAPNRSALLLAPTAPKAGLAMQAPCNVGGTLAPRRVSHRAIS